MPRAANTVIKAPKAKQNAKGKATKAKALPRQTYVLPSGSGQEESEHTSSSDEESSSASESTSEDEVPSPPRKRKSESKSLKSIKKARVGGNKKHSTGSKPVHQKGVKKQKNAPSSPNPNAANISLPLPYPQYGYGYPPPQSVPQGYYPYPPPPFTHLPAASNPYGTGDKPKKKAKVVKKRGPAIPKGR